MGPVDRENFRNSEHGRRSVDALRHPTSQVHSNCVETPGTGPDQTWFGGSPWHRLKVPSPVRPGKQSARNRVHQGKCCPFEFRAGKGSARWSTWNV